MTKPTIMIPRELPSNFAEAVAALGDIRVANIHENPIPDASLMSGVSIYFTTAFDAVSKALIESFPNSIKLIASVGIGVDHIDLDAAEQRGIAVSNTPVVTEDTADLTFALLLATARKLSICERLLRDNRWGDAGTIMGHRVHGKTLGVIGFGAIGQAVANRAKGFDMQVIYHDPTRKPEAEAKVGARFMENLDDLLGNADIVSLNCGLFESTHHLMNAGTLAKMKKGAVLINTGRGPLIDEAALITALRNGHLGAAGLDVYEFEPEVSPELMKFDNVTLLPHIGSASAECRADMARCALENLTSFINSGTLITPVIPPKG